MCLGCSPGSYSTSVGANSSRTCRDCEPGKYSSSDAASHCVDCPAGKYSSTSGGHISTICTRCNVSFCNLGEYREGCSAGSIRDATCLVCTHKKDHAHFVAHGGYNDECLEECTPPFREDCATGVCKLCDPGEVSVESVASDGEVEYHCLRCPAGGTCDGSDKVECEASRYLNWLVEPECLPCPEGAVSASGLCALRSQSLLDKVIGTWVRALDGRYWLVGCPVGHRIVNETGYETQKCQACSIGNYISNSNDPALSCMPCPHNARCPDGGPPLFGETKIEGTLRISSTTGQAAEQSLLAEALAASLGIHISMVQMSYLGIVDGQRRRTKSDVELTSFTVFASAHQADGLQEAIAAESFSSVLTEELSLRNVSASVEPPALQRVVSRPQDEVWKLSRGVYVLRACPVGHVLINTTIETQKCSECEHGSFSMLPTLGCDADSERCDARPCQTCPVGARCERGSSARWQHFVPKMLRLGETVLGSTVLVHGQEIEFECDQDCRPRHAPSIDGRPRHVWEYVESKGTFLLRSCPPGHRLVNATAGGTFSPTLQVCHPCGVHFYVVEGNNGDACQECPVGSWCPDGAQFLPTTPGSEWENKVTANGLQKRIVSCPPGFKLSYQADLPKSDACVPCAPGTYRLDRSTRISSECELCPLGAQCAGSTVESREGYWRAPQVSLEMVPSSRAPQMF